MKIGHLCDIFRDNRFPINENSEILISENNYQFNLKGRQYKNLSSSESKISIEIKYLFNYQNGYSVEVITKDNIICKYIWKYINKSSQIPKDVPIFYAKDITELQKIHWSSEDFSTLIQLWSEEKFRSLDDFDNFTEFDKLYAGGRWDGMLYKLNGTQLSNIIIVDYTTASIYLKINSLSIANEFLRKSEKYPWITNCEVIDIPSYNWDDPDEPQSSVNFSFHAPQDIFNKAVKYYMDNKEKYCSRKDGIITYIGEGILNEEF